MRVALITEDRYENPDTTQIYEQQILAEDLQLIAALKKLGLEAVRVSWSNPRVHWPDFALAVLRTPWDYFHRFQEFSAWLDKTAEVLPLVNPPETVRWNMNKRYLFELASKGITIPNGRFVGQGEATSLDALVKDTRWDTVIIKPAVSGAARETYKFNHSEVRQYANHFANLVAREDMLVQEFQHDVLQRGEYSLMYFGGVYSHAVLKKAKPGDFRVQDDFGGSFEKVNPPKDMKTFADRVLEKTPYEHTYARVDVMVNNEGLPCLAELELIEPELWLRLHPEASMHFAKGIAKSASRLGINS